MILAILLTKVMLIVKVVKMMMMMMLVHRSALAQPSAAPIVLEAHRSGMTGQD